MSRRLTTEQFIEKAKKVHRDKYSYELTEYVKSHNKVIITCKDHGDFLQKPNSHLNGYGCAECAGTKKLTSESFKKRAKKIHKNKYDYSLVEYKNANTKVKIICLKHGEFEQKAYSHLQGHECPKCGVKKRADSHKYSQEEFISKAIDIHRNKYSYSEVEYKHNKVKVRIICKEHGEFTQAPSSHLQGQGCPTCFRSSRSNNDYGATWNFTEWDKVGKKSKKFESFKVYILKCWNNEEEFYKIGKTYLKLKDRFKSKEKIPYNYETIKIFIGTAEDMSELEKQLQKNNKHNSYIPKTKFNGYKECFTKIEL